MYVESAEDARAFALALRRKARTFAGVDILLAPPYPFIAEVADVLASSPVLVGAQAVSVHADAPHTGDVSGAMLKNVGASFVIVGHSERRAMGETNDMVHTALERAAAANLPAILCVGEREREAEGPAYDGTSDHFAFVEAQLTSALVGLPPAALKKLIIAYEPVWAIGKSAADAMQPEDLEEMVIFIRKMLSEVLDRKSALRVPILYGGSVDPSNAPQLLAEGGVNGFLVGRASTTIDSFFEILGVCK